jgi:hypothetical protein
MESRRWRELLAENITNTHDFLSVVLPRSLENASEASQNSNLVGEQYSPMDIDMEDNSDGPQDAG